MRAHPIRPWRRRPLRPPAGAERQRLGEGRTLRDATDAERAVKIDFARRTIVQKVELVVDQERLEGAPLARRCAHHARERLQAARARRANERPDRAQVRGLVLGQARVLLDHGGTEAAQGAALREPGQHARLRALNVQLHDHDRAWACGLRARKHLGAQPVCQVDRAHRGLQHAFTASAQPDVLHRRGGHVGHARAGEEEGRVPLGRPNRSLGRDRQPVARRVIRRLELA
mmetsp:Transcript_10631/g.33496  ORF Transcript_10631/g.33496 Transcript_10631/m.33496 type:complete len:230 (+) Transcript_10631:497-1186(+)